jgi:type I restriction enzyme, S subunit
MVATPMAVTTDGAWHGAVPAGWSLKQLKWAVTFQRGHDLPTEDRQEGPVPVVTGCGITGWHNVAQARGPGIVTGRYGTIGEFYLVEQDYWPLNTSLYSIDLHGNHAGFLRYMLEPLAPLFHINAVKSAVPGIDRSDIHTIPVAVPPLATQSAIANYLDRETARLDGLVAAKERVLGLVAEKRRGLITRAVTRGLDPHAPLRDSGIPWLGEIPAHWEVQRLKFLVPRIEQGWSPECHNVPASDEEWGVLKAGCCNGGVFNQQENKSLPLNLAPPLELEVKPGDILMSRASGSTDLIGSVAMVPEGTRSRLLLSDKTYRIWLDTTRAIPSYFVIALESDVGRVQVQEVVSGAAGLANNIAQGDIKEFAVPLPPMDEQAAIVAHITAETAKMGALCAATERTIALLKERRAALIASAVTGKLDVQGAERHLDVVAD